MKRGQRTTPRNRTIFKSDTNCIGAKETPRSFIIGYVVSVRMKE